jgi:hypothetical protein
MKVQNTPFIAAALLGLFVFVSNAAGQQPNPTPKTSDDSKAVEAGEDAGNYTIITSFEVGYRGQRVDGDLNKYRSDLNYKAGPRVFDSSFYMRSKEGHGAVDSLVITSTGWGGDPHGNLRISTENSKWFRFDGTYRRFKYFRFLNNFVNPNWVFSPATFSVAPNPLTGQHGYNTKTDMGDFDLTLLPKNRIIKFTLGYSPERYDGPAFTNYHIGGNEFNLLQNLRSRANDFRFGADGELGPVDWSFLQGFRHFREDSTINLGRTSGVNLNPAVASLNSFTREEPTRGTVNFTRFSAHTTVAKRLDITGRIIYSKSESNFGWFENFTGVNWNPRVTGWPPTPPAATPNTLNAGRYAVTGSADRPNTVGDIGATWLVTDKLRISNTFRVEDFKINGDAVFSDFFSITRGSGATARTDTVGFNNLDAHRLTEYRKYQNTIEGDYQFNAGNSVHIGYRYGQRRVLEAFEGFNLGSNGSLTPPNARSSESEEEENHTHAFIFGFRVRPLKNWTGYFDAERGSADNVFTRIGNYDYTNVRAKSRYSPTKKLAFNVTAIIRDNANPSEIAGVSIADFGVSIKSRIFTTSVDWTPNSKFNINAGYNYNWVNSNAVVDYFFNSVRHPLGRSLYFMRNSFFFIDTTIQIVPRATLFTSYRVNHDNGQGTRAADPTGNPGILISSYPMTYHSPEARLAIKLHRRLDWNLGYQYYNYNESLIVGPRPQNYHAHLPYTSLRFYFGRKE